MSAPLTSEYALKMKNASTRLENILVSVKKAIREMTGDSAQKLSSTLVTISSPIDINECKEKNVCSDICVNTPGSYQCECEKGYKLGRDGRTCKGKHYFFLINYWTIIHTEVTKMKLMD